MVDLRQWWNRKHETKPLCSWRKHVSLQTLGQRDVTMKQTLLVLALIFFVSACTINESHEQKLANPASVHCVNQGGTLRMEETAAGQYGICILHNGTECEEWAYYRGECGAQK